jgi:hypothetical protein
MRKKDVPGAGDKDYNADILSAITIDAKPNKKDAKLLPKCHSSKPCLEA